MQFFSKSYKSKSLVFSSFFIFVLTFNSCASRIPVSLESQHETKVWILENNAQVEHPYLDKLFNSILARLALGYRNLGVTFPRQVEIILIDNQKVGVFSICDGTIFISTGTIKHLNSAHELTALLAHDVAHVYLEHACYRSEEKDIPEYETSADTFAIKTLQATHIDPGKLLNVYKKIYRKSEDRSSAEFDELDSVRQENLISRLNKIDQVPTKIPEERLFRKLKALL